jgi:NAD(P)-dependent dehydrogenase (short-subunit alcohol dehydrogenase family)
VHDLISAGAFVAILDLAAPSALTGDQVKFIETDITSLPSITSAVSAVASWIASSTHMPLGGVINCAGVGTAAKIIDSSGQSHDAGLWDWTIQVNLTGSFNLTRLVLEELVKVEKEEGEDGERGVIIFVSSAAAVSVSQLLTTRC